MWTINLLKGDIIEKYLLLTFMRVVLSVGEIQLGKNLLRLHWDTAVCWPLYTLAKYPIDCQNIIQNNTLTKMYFSEEKLLI